MGNYNIDINLNMGSGGSGNFQQLIDATNNLAANFDKVSTAGTNAGNSTKQSFSDSMGVMAQYGFSVKAVSKEISNLKKQIIQQNEALLQGRITESQYRDNVNNLHKSLTQLQRSQKSYNQLLGQTTTHAKNATTAVGRLSSVFNKLGAVLGVSFGLYGLFRVLQNGVKTIADFDLAQKKLQSILGETSAGMQELTQSAIDLGKNSIFGAKGVSELQIELAKMGFTKNEIMAMQGAINNLAIATQEELAPAAEVVANIIKAFGLTAKDATMVVDVMGKAFNDSALDLSNFREAIKYVAPVAKQAGFSIQETVAALELLSNVGLKGSLAGTGLNNVLKAMMDSNSKLAKSMGGTVKGYDGFISVLRKASDEGWSTEKIFGLITQRATASFTTFMNGVDQIETFRVSLENAAGTMERQAAVQLDSISYKAKLAGEAFKAMILEMDSGNGLLSNAIKTLLDSITKSINANKSSLDLFREQTKATYDLSKGIVPLVARYDELTAKAKLTKNEQDELRKIIIDVADAVPSAVKEFDRYGFALDINSAKAKSYISDQILLMKVLNKDAIDEAQDKLDKINGKIWTARRAYENVLKTGLIRETRTTGGVVPTSETFTRKASEQEIKEAKWRFQALEEEQRGYLLLIEELKGDAFKKELERRQILKSMDEGDTGGGDGNDEEKEKRQRERLKGIQKEYNERINLLKEEMQTEALRINTIEDNYLREILLATNKNKYLKQINELEIERDKKLGEYSLNTKKIYAEKEKQIELERIAELKKASDELIKESDKLAEDFLKESNKSVDGIGDEILDTVLADIDKSLKSNVYFDKWKKDNPILNALIGGKVKEGLLSGILSEEQISDMTESLNTVFDEMGKAMSDYADNWVEQTDRIVDQLNRQVDETQSALETEIALMEGGYANNVTLKRKELEEVKKMREEALADQRKAQIAQQILDTTTQVSSLITAAAQIYKSVAAIPFLGVGIATGLVVAMLGAFAAAKVKAFQLASTNKYEYGGWIGGKRHTNGGTIIEAERDEFIINRKSAVKHKGLVEAINNDNQFEINRFYLNKMKGNMITAKVSLDDSKDLKAIRKLMESGDKQVEYLNGYRIERTGNIVKRIKLLN